MKLLGRSELTAAGVTHAPGKVLVLEGVNRGQKQVHGVAAEHPQSVYELSQKVVGIDEAIGLGYVPIDYTEPGTELRVVVRDDPKEATVRELPFL